jgi:hypothetical protein
VIWQSACVETEVRPVREVPEPPIRRGANGERDRPARTGYARRPTVLIAAALVLAIAVGIAVWLLVSGEDESSRPRRAPAKAASIRALNTFASSVRHPVYWAGSQPRFTYELSRTKDGRIYIRYLPPGEKPGDQKPNYLTVGTYPQRNAFATLRATAKKQKARTIRLAGGGLAFQDKGRPTSVYLAYPGLEYQIEVFDPSPARAHELVASAQIKPVGAPPRTQTGSAATSVQQLKALAVKLGHPIYWAGAEPNDTYEFTRTKDGSLYVRYLPQGISVGDPRPNYLTIGTYPQKGALKILKATAAKNQVPTMNVDNGGLAFVDKKHPTSVYIAYPNTDFQIEVYDPAPGRARQLVTSGQITPVR